MSGAAIAWPFCCGSAQAPAFARPRWPYAGAVRTVALVGDLMDRSRISAAAPDVTFVSEPGACEGAELVVVDLGRHAGAVAAVRALAPGARIVAFGRHDDPESLARALADGADASVARSRFFRDPLALLGAGRARP
jgi:hypothetical protein